MSQGNVEIVRRVAESFRRAVEEGDFRRSDLVEAGLVDPDFEWIPATEVPTAESYRGTDEFAGFMETWTEDLEGWTFEIERIIDAGDDHVVAIVHQKATGKASGAPVDLKWGLLFELGGGRVIRMRNFLDPAKALEAAGLSE